MIFIGIVFGLLAAFFQASSYIFSRLFVMNTKKPVLRLFTISHIIMGVISLVMLPFLLPEEMPGPGSYWRPLAQSSGCYLIGQIILFRIMSRAEASRISPLLGIKIVILALITVFVLGESLSLQKWAAVFLCTAAAFLLNFTGGTLPRGVIATGFLLCIAYAVSDLGIADLIAAMGKVDHPALLATCLCYMVCGIVALACLPSAGPGKVLENWRYSVSFSLLWFIAMICLFVCFGHVGPVFGNVLQSTRGIISVLTGTILAGMGYVMLEQEQPGHVVLRRAAAALLMCVAVWLFAAG